MKSYHQLKTCCKIFATFKFVIVLLAAQVNRKIESDIKFSGRHVNSQNSEASVSNDGKIPGFCFC